MVAAASFRIGKLQLPSLQRAAWIPLRQAKGIQAAFCKDGSCSFPILNEAAATAFAKGSQSPFLHAVAAKA